jgi:hypothetical protein
MSSDGYPHVVTSATEGQFSPGVGYEWTDQSKLQVDWRAAGTDLSDQGYPNVVTTDTEGQVVPADGYHFTDASNLQVEADDSGQPAETDGQKAERQLGDLIGAVIAKKLSEPQDGDSPLATNVGRPLAGVAADQFENDMNK